MLESIPEILTFQECQALLKIGKNSMLDLIHDDEIEAFMVKGKWRIPKQSIFTYIRRHS